MGGRGFCVKIEIDLQAVTCPGVWLCPNGKVALRINTLDSKIESRRLTPAFPLVYHDKFRCKKLFTGVSTLAELQNSLEDEYLYAELIQWSSPKGTSVILATFETNLADLLYPPSCSKGLLAGSEVDLLMEPTKHFPGILAPKIEVSTRTIIEEVVGVFEATISGSRIINPKMINSKNGTCMHRKRPPTGIIRQRKVCHTQGKPKVQGNRSLRRRHPSPEETISSPSSTSNNCSQSHIDHCCQKSKGMCSSIDHPIALGTSEIPPCRKSSHIFENCPVCSKYKCYFSHNHEARIKHLKNGAEHCTENLRNINDSGKCSRRSCIERDGDRERGRPRSAPQTNSIHDSSSLLAVRAKPTELQGLRAKSSNASDPQTADYFDSERDQGRQGFYKNLEKFYKRMYKQAKLRAREVDCS